MTAEALAELITSCLDDVRAGRLSAEECLRQHPEAADELRPLLGVATAIRLEGTPAMDEALKARGRAQLLAAISSNGHHHAAGLNDVRAWPALTFNGWLLGRRWLAGLGAAFGALLAGGAVVYASQSAQPDTPLYPIREAVATASQALPLPVKREPLPTVSPSASPTATVNAADAAVSPVAVPSGQRGDAPAVVRLTRSPDRDDASLSARATGRDRDDGPRQQATPERADGRGPGDAQRGQDGDDGRGNAGRDGRSDDGRSRALRDDGATFQGRAGAAGTLSSSQGDGDRRSGSDGDGVRTSSGATSVSSTSGGGGSRDGDGDRTSISSSTSGGSGDGDRRASPSPTATAFSGSSSGSGDGDRTASATSTASVSGSGTSGRTASPTPTPSVSGDGGRNGSAARSGSDSAAGLSPTGTFAPRATPGAGRNGRGNGNDRDDDGGGGGGR